MKAPLACLLVLLLAGCGQDVTTPTEPGAPHGSAAASNPSVSVPAPDTAALPPDLSPSDTALLLHVPPLGIVGQQLAMDAYFVDAYGVLGYAERVHWKSSDAAVAQVSGAGWRGTLTIVGPGTVTITATTSAATDSVLLTTVASEPPVSEALVAESFEVWQIGDTEYAPLMTLRDREGDGARIIGFQLQVPGLGNTPYCWTNREIASGRTLQLFRELYGDYELTYSGVGRTEGPATAVVYLLDGGGRPGKLLLSTPIVPGPQPSTYTGGRNLNPWMCGAPWPLPPGF